jgi:hypothetical protein
MFVVEVITFAVDRMTCFPSEAPRQWGKFQFSPNSSVIFSKPSTVDGIWNAKIDPYECLHIQYNEVDIDGGE